MSDYESMRQWLVLALLGKEISAAEAAARMSRIDKAEQQELRCPDIRSDFHEGFDATAADL